MKESKKIAIISFSTLLVTAAIPAVCISIPFIKRNKFTNKIVNETVDLFMNDISKIYRSSFYTRKIADWIKSYVSNLNFSITEDEYREPSYVETSSGNLYYDIPATSGFEKFPGVTLQAHMDMVCEVSEDRKTPYDWSKGVEVVKEGNILHSKDWQTSIGADNGIGLALLLILTKHHNEFDHGPLRILITADEENGDSGASALTPEKIKYDNVINIDGEVLGEIIKSCAGTYNARYSIPMTWLSITPGYNQYKITVTGFTGGHSGADIQQGMSSAIKGASKVLNDLLDVANVELINFVSNNSNSAISRQATFTIATNIDDIGSWIENEKSVLKQTFTKDPNCTVTYEAVNSFNSCLDNQITKDFAYVLNKLDFGVTDWLDVGHVQPKTSTNIGPLAITNNFNWDMELMCRSLYEKEEVNLTARNFSYIKSKFSHANEPSIVSTPAWEYKPNVALVNLTSKAFKSSKVTPHIENSHGWLECSYICKNRPNADIVSIGVDIKESHSSNERIDISSIKPILETLLFTLVNIKSK